MKGASLRGRWFRRRTSHLRHGAITALGLLFTSAKLSTLHPPPPPPLAVEPIFPPELRKRQPAELRIEGPQCTWYRPLTLDSLLAIKAEHPAAKLVVGNTGGYWIRRLVQ